jgi:hypothetical protein
MVEGLAHGAVKALGEEFERGGFDADEVSGGCGGFRHLAKKMLAEGKE